MRIGSYMEEKWILLIGCRGSRTKRLGCVLLTRFYVYPVYGGCSGLVMWSEAEFSTLCKQDLPAPHKITEAKSATVCLPCWWWIVLHQVWVCYCGSGVTSPEMRGFHFCFSHPEPSVTYSCVLAGLKPMDVIIRQIISKYHTKVCVWRGQSKEKTLKRKLSWKNRREITDFPEKQVVQGCPCSLRIVYGSKGDNTGYYTMNVEFSLKAPQWDISIIC